MYNTDQLIDFFVGDGLDSAGRSFERVLAMDDAALERTHNYIQWLFPLATESMAVPDSPILTVQAIALLRGSGVARCRSLEAFERMLCFYGMLLEDDIDEPSVDKGANWSQRKRIWLTPGNHNYRRVTRILRSLQLFGHTPYSVAFFDCLTRIHREHAGLIGPAYIHWKAVALGRSRPDADRN